MNVYDLIRTQLALEGIGVDDEGQLIRVPCLNPDTLHRVYVARYPGGATIFFQAGLHPALCSCLLRLPVTEFFENPQRVRAILAEDRPCESSFIGKSYVFPDTISVIQYPDVLHLSQADPELVRQYNPEIDPNHKEVFGVMADGKIVATCESSREDDAAGEAWVFTLEPYRRRGYARQLTAAWGHWLQKRGKTPFYSHLRENLASQAVAQSLGLIQWVEGAGYG
jgi:GNAT superfamily N-acetyltransferase